MSDRSVLAMIQSLLGGSSSQEEVLLFNELARRLILSGVTVSTGGAFSLTVPIFDISTISGAVQGDLIYGSAVNVYSKLAKNASATRYVSNTGGSNNPAWAQINLPDGVTGLLPLANGSTQQTTVTQGDLLFASAADTWAKLAKHTSATRYLSNTGGSNAPAWAQINLPDGVTGALPVANLGNGTHTPILSTEASNQNNWAPGLVGNTVIFWSGAANITITGLAGGVSGQRVTFRNTGANIATFSHNSGSSSAGNKLFNTATSAGTPVSAGGSAVYQYDGTQWQLVSHEQGAWITTTFSAGNYTAVTAGTWTVGAGDVVNERYRLSGRTLSLTFEYTTTTVGQSGGNPTQLAIGNGAWGGFTGAGTIQGFMIYSDNGAGNVTGYCQSAAGTFISLNHTVSAQWSTATDTTLVLGSIMFDVT